MDFDITERTKPDKLPSDVSKLMTDAAIQRLGERVTCFDKEGNSFITTGAEALVDRMVSIALYSENEKNAISAAKFIKETAQGRDPVRSENITADMPRVEVRLTPFESERIDSLASLPEPADDSGKVVVDFGDGTGMVIDE